MKLTISKELKRKILILRLKGLRAELSMLKRLKIWLYLRTLDKTLLEGEKDVAKKENKK